MRRNWRDYLPPRISIWPVVGAALTIWLAWQLWVVLPRAERGKDAVAVAMLTRAQAALSRSVAAERASRDSARQFRRERDSIRAAIPPARPVVVRQVTLVPPTTDTLLRRVAAERDTARRDVEQLRADTTTLRTALRGLDSLSVRQERVDSTRAAVVAPALDTVAAAVDTAKVTIRPRWSVRAVRWLGRRTGDLAKVALGFGLGALR